MRPRSVVCFALACGVAGAVSGCGSAGPAGLPASTGSALHRELAKVQAAAGRGDRAGALAALSAFSGDVARHAGQLTADQQAALRTGISRLRRRIETSVTPPAATTTATSPSAPATTTTTTTTAPSSPAPAPPPHPGHGPHGGPPPHPKAGHAKPDHGKGGHGKH